MHASMTLIKSCVCNRGGKLPMILRLQARWKNTASVCECPPAVKELLSFDVAGLHINLRCCLVRYQFPGRFARLVRS